MAGLQDTCNPAFFVYCHMKDQTLSTYLQSFRCKVAAYLTVSIFTVSTLLGYATEAYAQPMLSPVPQILVNIPKDYGVLKNEIDSSHDAPRIFHIQNAHTNYETQKNIEKIIEFLTSTYDVDTLCVEGAAGGVDTSLFRSFPLEDTKRELIDRFVREGRITGAEEYAIMAHDDIDLYGVEDESLYVEHVATCVEAVSLQPEIQTFVRHMQRVLESLQKEVYSERLQTFIIAQQAYIKTGALIPFLRLLFEEASESSIALNRYPLLHQFADFSRFQESIDPTTIERETDACITDILNAVGISDSQLEELALMELQFKAETITPVVFYRFLKERSVAVGLDFSQYQNIQRYYYYLWLIQELDVSALNKEIDRVSKRVVYQLCRSTLEKELYRHSHAFEIATKIVSLQAIPPNIAYYRQNQTLFTDASFQALFEKMGRGSDVRDLEKTGSQSLLSLDQVLPIFKRFYELAEKRESAIVAQTLDRMKRTGKKTAILVTGGYHTPGILHEAKKNDLSCSVITPKITGDGTGDRYHEIMNGYSKYFGVREGSRGGTVEVLSSITQLVQTKANSKEVEALRDAILPQFVDAIMQHPESEKLVQQWNTNTTESAIVARGDKEEKSLLFVTQEELLNLLRSPQAVPELIKKIENGEIGKNVVSSIQRTRDKQSIQANTPQGSGWYATESPEVFLQTLFNQAEDHRFNSNNEAAVELYTQVIKAGIENEITALAYHNRAILCDLLNMDFDDSDCFKAEELMRKHNILHREFSTILSTVGTSYDNQGAYQKAAEKFVEALSHLKPQKETSSPLMRPYLTVKLAECYFKLANQTGNNEYRLKARTNADQAFRQMKQVRGKLQQSQMQTYRSRMYHVTNLRSHIYQFSGDYVVALSSAEEAHKIKPDEFQPLYVMALCLYFLKRYDEAEQQLLRLNVDEQGAIYQFSWFVTMANIYRHTQRYAQAIECFKKAIAVQEKTGVAAPNAYFSCLISLGLTCYLHKSNKDASMYMFLALRQYLLMKRIMNPDEVTETAELLAYTKLIDEENVLMQKDLFDLFLILGRVFYEKAYFESAVHCFSVARSLVEDRKSNLFKDVLFRSVEAVCEMLKIVDDKKRYVLGFETLRTLTQEYRLLFPAAVKEFPQMQEQYIQYAEDLVVHNNSAALRTSLRKLQSYLDDLSPNATSTSSKRKKLGRRAKKRMQKTEDLARAVFLKEQNLFSIQLEVLKDFYHKVPSDEQFAIKEELRAFDTFVRSGAHESHFVKYSKVVQDISLLRYAINQTYMEETFYMSAEGERDIAIRPVQIPLVPLSKVKRGVDQVFAQNYGKRIIIDDPVSSAKTDPAVTETLINLADELYEEIKKRVDGALWSELEDAGYSAKVIDLVQKMYERELVAAETLLAPHDVAEFIDRQPPHVLDFDPQNSSGIALLAFRRGNVIRSAKTSKSVPSVAFMQNGDYRRGFTYVRNKYMHEYSAAELRELITRTIEHGDLSFDRRILGKGKRRRKVVNEIYMLPTTGEQVFVVRVDHNSGHILGAFPLHDYAYKINSLAQLLDFDEARLPQRNNRGDVKAVLKRVRLIINEAARAGATRSRMFVYYDSVEKKFVIGDKVQSQYRTVTREEIITKTFMVETVDETIPLEAFKNNPQRYVCVNPWISPVMNETLPLPGNSDQIQRDRMHFIDKVEKIHKGQVHKDDKRWNQFNTTDNASKGVLTTSGIVSLELLFSLSFALVIFAGFWAMSQPYVSIVEWFFIAGFLGIIPVIDQVYKYVMRLDILPVFHEYLVGPPKVELLNVASRLNKSNPKTIESRKWWIIHVAAQTMISGLAYRTTNNFKFNQIRANESAAFLMYKALEIFFKRFFRFVGVVSVGEDQRYGVPGLLKIATRFGSTEWQGVWGKVFRWIDKHGFFLGKEIAMSIDQLEGSDNSIRKTSGAFGTVFSMGEPADYISKPDSLYYDKIIIRPPADNSQIQGLIDLETRDLVPKIAELLKKEPQKLNVALLFRDRHIDHNGKGVIYQLIEAGITVETDSIEEMRNQVEEDGIYVNSNLFLVSNDFFPVDGLYTGKVDCILRVGRPTEAENQRVITSIRGGFFEGRLTSYMNLKDGSPNIQLHRDAPKLTHEEIGRLRRGNMSDAIDGIDTVKNMQDLGMAIAYGKETIWDEQIRGVVFDADSGTVQVDVRWLGSSGEVHLYRLTYDTTIPIIKARIQSLENELQRYKAIEKREPLNFFLSISNYRKGIINTQLVKECKDLAAAYLEFGDFDAAIQTVNALLERDGSRKQKNELWSFYYMIEGYRGLVESQTKRKAVFVALNNLSRAVKMSPSNSEAKRLLRRLWNFLADSDRVKAEALEEASVMGEVVDDVEVMAKTRYARNRYARALDLFPEAVRLPADEYSRMLQKEKKRFIRHELERERLEYKLVTKQLELTDYKLKQMKKGYFVYRPEVMSSGRGQSFFGILADKYMEIADLFSEFGFHHRAVQYHEKSIQMDEYVFAYAGGLLPGTRLLKMGRFYHDAKMYEKARRMFARLIDPNDAYFIRSEPYFREESELGAALEGDARRVNKEMYIKGEYFLSGPQRAAFYDYIDACLDIKGISQEEQEAMIEYAEMWLKTVGVGQFEMWALRDQLFSDNGGTLWLRDAQGERTDLMEIIFRGYKKVVHVYDATVDANDSGWSAVSLCMGVAVAGIILLVGVPVLNAAVGGAQVSDFISNVHWVDFLYTMLSSLSLYGVLVLAVSRVRSIFRSGDMFQHKFLPTMESAIVTIGFFSIPGLLFPFIDGFLRSHPIVSVTITMLTAITAFMAWYEHRDIIKHHSLAIPKRAVDPLTEHYFFPARISILFDLLLVLTVSSFMAVSSYGALPIVIGTGALIRYFTVVTSDMNNEYMLRSINRRYKGDLSKLIAKLALENDYFAPEQQKKITEISARKLRPVMVAFDDYNRLVFYFKEPYKAYFLYPWFRIFTRVLTPTRHWIPFSEHIHDVWKKYTKKRVLARQEVPRPQRGVWGIVGIGIMSGIAYFGFLSSDALAALIEGDAVLPGAGFALDVYKSAVIGIAGTMVAMMGGKKKIRKQKKPKKRKVKKKTSRKRPSIAGLLDGLEDMFNNSMVIDVGAGSDVEIVLNNKPVPSFEEIAEVIVNSENPFWLREFSDQMQQMQMRDVSRMDICKIGTLQAMLLAAINEFDEALESLQRVRYLARNFNFPEYMIDFVEGYALLSTERIAAGAASMANAASFAHAESDQQFYIALGKFVFGDALLKFADRQEMLEANIDQLFNVLNKRLGMKDEYRAWLGVISNVRHDALLQAMKMPDKTAQKNLYFACAAIAQKEIETVLRDRILELSDESVRKQIAVMYSDLGRAHIGLEAYSDAISQFEIAEQYDSAIHAVHVSERAISYRVLTQAALRAGDIELALKYSEAVLNNNVLIRKTKIDKREFQFYKAICVLNKGNFNEALTLLSYVTKGNYQNRVIELYEQFKTPDLARYMFDLLQFSRLNPDDILSLAQFLQKVESVQAELVLNEMVLAVANLIESQQYDLAEKKLAMMQVLALKSGDMKKRIRQKQTLIREIKAGTSERSSGNISAASNRFKQALAIQPDNAFVNKAIKQLEQTAQNKKQMETDLAGLRDIIKRAEKQVAAGNFPAAFKAYSEMADRIATIQTVSLPKIDNESLHNVFVRELDQFEGKAIGGLDATEGRDAVSVEKTPEIKESPPEEVTVAAPTKAEKRRMRKKKKKKSQAAPLPEVVTDFYATPKVKKELDALSVHDKKRIKSELEKVVHGGSRKVFKMPDKRYGQAYPIDVGWGGFRLLFLVSQENIYLFHFGTMESTTSKSAYASYQGFSFKTAVTMGSIAKQGTTIRDNTIFADVFQKQGGFNNPGMLLSLLGVSIVLSFLGGAYFGVAIATLVKIFAVPALLFCALLFIIARNARIDAVDGLVEDDPKDMKGNAMSELRVNKDIVATIASLLGADFQEDHDHGLSHARDLMKKVVITAEHMGISDEVDWDVMTAAVYLHDAFYLESRTDHGTKASDFARDHLNDVFTSEQMQKLVTAILLHDKNPTYLEKRKNASFETQLLYFADNWDAFGIKGVYRYIAVNIKRGRDRGYSREKIERDLKGYILKDLDERYESLPFGVSVRRELLGDSYQVARHFFKEYIKEEAWAVNIVDALFTSSQLDPVAIIEEERRVLDVGTVHSIEERRIAEFWDVLADDYSEIVQVGGLIGSVTDDVILEEALLDSLLFDVIRAILEKEDLTAIRPIIVELLHRVVSDEEYGEAIMQTLVAVAENMNAANEYIQKKESALIFHKEFIDQLNLSSQGDQDAWEIVRNAGLLDYKHVFIACEENDDVSMEFLLQKVSNYFQVSPSRVSTLPFQIDGNDGDFSFLGENILKQYRHIIVFNARAGNSFSDLVVAASRNTIQNTVRVVEAETVLGYFEIGDIMDRIDVLFEYDGRLTQEARTKLELYFAFHDGRDYFSDSIRQLQNTRIFTSFIKEDVAAIIKSVEEADKIKVFA